MEKIEALLPREKKTLETQKKVLDVAETMLAQYDFKYLTVQNICKMSNIAYGSFYHHFGTKENVISLCCKRLLKRNVEVNPCPEGINPADYISYIAWYCVLIAAFCEMMGKDLIRYLYLNSGGEDNLFGNVFEEKINPAIDAAYGSGYIRTKFSRQIPETETVANLKRDVRISTIGIILWWCCSDEGGREETLRKTMEHLMIRHTLSSRSEKYRSADFPHTLLSNQSISLDFHLLNFEEQKT